MRLPAVTKAITAVTKGASGPSWRSRTPKETEAMGTTVKEEGIKTTKVSKEMTEVEDRTCVVDIETLSFRPASGGRLQTARRGRRFIPGNIRMKQWTGKVKDTDLDSERGDADITIDNSPYNEWLAAQGLLCLSDDQPEEGYISKLHADSKKDKNSDDIKDPIKDDLTKEKSNDSTDEIENSDLTNQEEDILKKDDSMEKKTNWKGKWEYT